MNSVNWKRFLFHLRREFLLQLDGRRSYSRGVYQGVTWFAVLAIAVMLYSFNEFRFRNQDPNDILASIILLTSGQCCLLWFRSSVYCAASMSRDLQSRTVNIVTLTPISATRTLVAKLCACLAPLWTELLLFLPVSLLFFSFYLGMSPMSLVLTTIFLIAASILAGTLGLVIGILAEYPAHAIKNARLLSFGLLFCLPVLLGNGLSNSAWMLPVFGFYTWLLYFSRRSPHQTAATLTFSGILLVAACLNQASVFQEDFLHIHPILALSDFVMRDTSYSVALKTFGLSGFFCLTLGAYLAISWLMFGLARRSYTFRAR